MSQPYQPSIMFAETPVVRELLPAQLRTPECAFRRRVGSISRIEAGQAPQFFFAAEPDFSVQLFVKIAEEGKGIDRAPLFTHEQHRDLRREQINGRDRLDCRNGMRRDHSIAMRPVADLVVVLDEGDESRGW